MKKNIVLLLIAAVIVSSCNTYAGAGAYAGSQVGGMLGSFIGGISGGWRGSDVGGLVGMAGGAIIGAAVGSAADAQVQKERNQRYGDDIYRDNKAQNNRHRDNRYDDDNYLDESNSGDDRIDFTPSDGVYGSGKNSHETNRGKKHVRDGRGYDVPPFVDGKSTVEIRRLRFLDSNGYDNTLSAGELSKVSVELFNNAPFDIYNVQAVVELAVANKHVQLSAPVSVERIAAGKGIRYTAMIRADKKLKNGTVTIKAYALQNGKQISRVETFTLATRRR